LSIEITFSSQIRCKSAIICCLAKLKGGVKNPDEPRSRHFKRRNRRDTGQEEGGTHVFYSDFSGHGTETSN